MKWGLFVIYLTGGLLGLLGDELAQARVESRISRKFSLAAQVGIDQLGSSANLGTMLKVDSISQIGLNAGWIDGEVDDRIFGSLGWALGGMVEIASIHAYGGPELSFFLDPQAPNLWTLEMGGLGGVSFLFSPWTEIFFEYSGRGPIFSGSKKQVAERILNTRFSGGMRFWLD